MDQSLKNDEKVIDFLQKAQVSKAVKALLQYMQKREEQQQSLVTEAEGHRIQLQLIFRRIPRTKNVKIRITLPTSPASETTDVCLFVKDLDKKERDHEPTSRHFKELLSSKGVKNVAEVIPLKALKLEYQPFEAKRNLSNMYDVFLADARIIRLLAPLLGKHFYSRKRYPIQVNLEAKNLQEEFEKALHTTECVITGRGSSCLTEVGHTRLTESQTTDNIMAAVERLVEKIPGGQSNVHSLHIKTPSSPAIPLFVCFTSGEDVELPTKPKVSAPDELEEISTVVGAKVRVSRSGKVQVISDKDRTNNEGQRSSERNKKKTKGGKKRKAKTVGDDQRTSKKNFVSVKEESEVTETDGSPKDDDTQQESVTEDMEPTAKKARTPRSAKKKTPAKTKSPRKIRKK